MLFVKTNVAGYESGFLTQTARAEIVWTNQIDAGREADDSYIIVGGALYPFNSPKPPIKYEPVGNGQCVALVQAHGYSEYSGNANEWVKYINSNKPKIGNVVVLTEGYYGHVAIVVEVGDDWVKIVEQNYEGLGVVSYRTISMDYVNIVGYIDNEKPL